MKLNKMDSFSIIIQDLILNFKVLFSSFKLSNFSKIDSFSIPIQDGVFNFVVPMATSSWTIVVTFDKPITTLSPWQGILVSPCVGGTVCTFTNQVQFSWTLFFWLFPVNFIFQFLNFSNFSFKNQVQFS